MDTIDTTTHYLTVQFLAARWKISPITVRAMIERGELRAIRLGARGQQRIERKSAAKIDPSLAAL